MPNAFPQQRKPWSIRWIVLAIVVFIIGYTFLTLHYRKPGKAYQPAEDMKNRATTARLIKAGYQRVQLTAQLPADPVAPANAGLQAPGGLPEDLRSTLIAVPLLPADIVAVNAPLSASASQPFTIHFRCVVPDEKRQVAGADMYVRADEIIVAPRFDKLTGGLTTRSAGYVVSLDVPAATLKPGHYRITLVGERMSRVWDMNVTR